MISINVLEMVCVIVHMVAAILVCDHDDTDLSSYTVLLDWHDNTAACTWINGNCNHSMIGRRLGCLFVALLMAKILGLRLNGFSLT